MNKILITGGAGAIGSNLANYMLSKDSHVIVIDDLSSGFKENLPSQVTFYKGSILDESLLDRIFQEHKIDYVFHLAALFANQNSVEHPDIDLQVNGLGTLKILEKSKHYHIKKVIYTSSSCVYGGMPIMDDKKPLHGKLDTPYAITKLLGEQYCQFFSSLHGLDTAIVRLFNAYGPGEKPGQYRNVIPNMLLKAIKGESLIITGTGNETRDFTFIEDVVYGIAQAGFCQTKPGEVFNLGSGVPTTIQALVEIINGIANNNSPIIYQPRRDWDHIAHRVADIQKARDLIGFAPKTQLENGVKKTYDWLIARV